MIAKAGLGLIGIGAISIGGVTVTKPHWLGMDYMPSYKSLADLTNHTTTYTSGKFGNKNGRYLVSNTEDNKNWWEWSFRGLERDGVNSGSFQFNEKVESGFKSTNNSKTLGKVCDDAYKAEHGKVKKDGSGSGEYEEEHVWKYCSPLGGKLKTVKEAENKSTNTNEHKYSGSKLGKTKEDELISITDPTNNKFWEIRDKEFRKEEGYKPLDTNDDAFFNISKQKSIKDLCEAAYKENGTSSGSSTATEPKTDQVVKYCALEKHQ